MLVQHHQGPLCITQVLTAVETRPMYQDYGNVVRGSTWDTAVFIVEDGPLLGYWYSRHRYAVCSVEEACADMRWNDAQLYVLPERWDLWSERGTCARSYAL